jgi:hypothetical protein
MVNCKVLRSVNFFSGSIPAEVCSNGNITEVVMGGLHAAQSCSNTLHLLLRIFGISSSYLQSNAIGGLLPTCIFDLQKLQYVSLSGNGLVGSFPQNLDIVTALQILDLSLNGLTASIPNALLEHEFSLFDLSFHRLTGTIPENVDEVALNSSLSLQVNLLSGVLPKAWAEVTSIKVLAGNINSYQCGSQVTNIALLCFLMLLIMSVPVLWRARENGVATDDRLS